MAYIWQQKKDSFLRLKYSPSQVKHGLVYKAFFHFLTWLLHKSNKTFPNKLSQGSDLKRQNNTFGSWACHKQAILRGTIKAGYNNFSVECLFIV